MSSAEWRPFCSGINVSTLKTTDHTTMHKNSPDLIMDWYVVKAPKSHSGRNVTFILRFSTCMIPFVTTNALPGKSKCLISRKHFYVNIVFSFSLSIFLWILLHARRDPFASYHENAKSVALRSYITNFIKDFHTLQNFRCYSTRFYLFFFTKVIQWI